MYTGDNAVTWANLYSKDSLIATGYGSVTADNRLILSQNTQTHVQIINPSSVGGVIDNYFVSTPSTNYIIYFADGILIKYGSNVNYDISLDNGDTWTAFPGPSGLWMRAVCKHQGLWVALFQLSSTQRIYTSSQAVPTTWTNRFSGFSGSSEHAIASDGGVVLTTSNSKDTYVSASGTTWVTHTNNLPFGFVSDSCVIVALGAGIFVMGSASTPNHSIYRTTNSGTTWTAIPLLSGTANITSMQFRYGKLVVCFTDGNVFISEDLGVSFTQYSPSEGAPGLLILPFFPVVGT
jgi:hypothetical protein